jgi:hypothetical protein
VFQETFETLPGQCRSSTFLVLVVASSWDIVIQNHLEILFVLQLVTTKWTFDTAGIDLRLKLSNPITIHVHCSNIPGMRHKKVRKSLHSCFTVLSVP